MARHSRFLEMPVDDGTAVLRIMQKRNDRRRAKKTSSLVDATGIPDCYIYSRWYKHDQSSAPFARAPMLTAIVPEFQLGDIVRCIGKIVTDKVSGCYMHIHDAGKLPRSHSFAPYKLTGFCI